MLSYKHIVVGTDLAAGSSGSLRAALLAANRFEAQRVHLVHVVNGSPIFPAPLLPDGRADVVAAQARAQDKLDHLEVPEIDAQVSREVRWGSPARELAMAADEHHADLAVVARRGHNALTRLVLGSVPNTLTRICNCPVLVLDDAPPEALSFDRVLAVVDLSAVSRLVLDNAIAVAKAYGGQVQVLSFLERPAGGADRGLAGSAEALDKAMQCHEDGLAALVRRVGPTEVPIETQVARTKGPVPPGIIEWAKAGGADLIVMGSSGRNAWHRMIMGSTANHVLLRAACAVMIVPPALRIDVEDAQLSGLPSTPVLGGNSPC